eukprot:TRINITY_DN16060_c0_g1_i1.p1 TRINITY_DN16060_c0_g1~~TRINITY_DN16060_c0_g1_i1.p1  ORF type:complete len:231 (+),score=48.00 TRINITY_DN16060_c0_g1_i1:68-760(+)
MDDDNLPLLRKLVAKRTETLGYLQRLYDGQVHFMNVINVKKQQITAYYRDRLKSSALAERNRLWFALGLCLPPMLEVDHSVLIDCLTRLLLEFREESCRQLPRRPDERAEAIRSKSKMLRTPNGIDSPMFVIARLPCPLDFVTVAGTLCELLSLIYQRFLKFPAPVSRDAYQSILEVDAFIRDNILKTIVTDTNTLATDLLNLRLISVNSIYNVNSMRARIAAENEEDEA